MQKGYVDDPSDLCVCDISGMDFTEVSTTAAKNLQCRVHHHFLHNCVSF